RPLFPGALPVVCGGNAVRRDARAAWREHRGRASRVRRGDGRRRLEARPKTLDERFGDPGGPDPGEPPSSGASALEMRERAAQAVNPEMGRMGAEDPSTAFRPGLYTGNTPCLRSGRALTRVE